MPVQTAVSGDAVPEGSFIHRARRTQLIDAAIEAIAEIGCERASTVQIAKRAGVSRGVLTYHFADRTDLLGAVVAHVYALARPEVGPPVTNASSPRSALLAFVASSIEFYARYPQQMTALKAIYASGELPFGRDGQVDHSAELDDVGRILTEGQGQGQFRSFDVKVMARTVRLALDVCLRQVQAGEDPAHLKEEMVATIDAATRAEVTP